jgi:hypothetical protein
MNYQRLYHLIMTKAQSRSLIGYCEKHHIIPRSIGGSNDDDNIARLTAKEHFVAHHLLIKCHIGKEKRKMQLAFWMMFKKSPLTSERCVSNARTYEWARKQASAARRGVPRTPETLAKMHRFPKGHKPWNTGIPKTDQEKEKLRAAQLGKPSGNKGHHYKHTPEAIAKIIAAGKRPCSEETKRKISLAQIGVSKPSMIGYKHTPETIEKLRLLGQRPRGPLPLETKMKISAALKGKPKQAKGQNAARS